ncbi:hypothetical protein F5884DRAFT_206135 [Xylogone sp. PMI_703]|nr:hypothetical protein F5884DRAFT_206135 [Xylogone sp. PMI_703]
MSLEDFIKEAEQVATGQGGQDGDNNASNGSNDKTIDTMVDSALDQFASKEGVPAAMDPEINNFVNNEINKFI